MIRSCPTPVPEQIERIGELRDGWCYDGQGTEFDPAFLYRCEVSLKRIAEFADWVPYIYPEPNGIVRAEFDTDPGLPMGVIEIRPGDDRMSLDIDDVDCWLNVDVEFAAEELRRIGHAN